MSDFATGAAFRGGLLPVRGRRRKVGDRPFPLNGCGMEVEWRDTAAISEAINAKIDDPAAKHQGVLIIREPSAWVTGSDDPLADADACRLYHSAVARQIARISFVMLVVVGLGTALGV